MTSATRLLLMAVGWIFQILWLFTAALGIGSAGVFLLGSAATTDQLTLTTILSRFNGELLASVRPYAVATVAMAILAYLADRLSGKE